MRWRCIPALIVSLSAAPAGADELTDRLEAVPGVSVVQELPDPEPGYRLFELSYAQQVNHHDPSKGTFEQRVALIHRSEDAPTVIVTDGYNTSFSPERAQVTDIVGGNQVRVEHRFFEPSRPEPADWGDLDIFQAATDHHRIVSALKSIYGGPWLATGVSKSGMEAVYYRRFYPDDVQGTVAYGAPNDVIDGVDHHAEFLASVGTDPACRDAVIEVQREALEHRDEMVALLQEQADEFGITYDHIMGSPERALDMMVVDLGFVFWQLAGQSLCQFVPPAGSPAEEIFFFLDSFVFAATYSDQLLEGNAAFFHQSAAELGFPTLPEDHLEDLLLFPGEDVPASFLPPEIDAPRHRPFAMLDIDRYVRLHGQRLMFIYGEFDPWYAEPFGLGCGTQDSYVYVVPGGTHLAHIGLLPPDQAAAATATIRRWAGLSGTADLREATTLGADLEREELERHPRL
jgi:hypothetical protein